MSEAEIAPAAPAAPPKERKPVEGIGGWLILPILNLIAMTLVFASYVFGTAETVFAPPTGYWQGNVFASGKFFSDAYFALSVALVGYAFLCLVFLFQKKKAAPKLMFWLYVLTILWTGIDAAGLFVFGDNQQFDSGMSNALVEFINTLLPAAIWITYFRVSKRVKNTFVR